MLKELKSVQTDLERVMKDQAQVLKDVVLANTESLGFFDDIYVSSLEFDEEESEQSFSEL